MSKKRCNELGQLEKSAYDALEESAGVVKEGSFERASSDMLQRRRTVRVSGKWNAGKRKETPAITVGVQGFQASSTSEASIVSTAMATALGTSKSNPFASVSFASNTKAEVVDTKKPVFSFMPTQTPSTGTGTAVSASDEMAKVNTAIQEQISTMLHTNASVDLSNILGDYLTHAAKACKPSSSAITGKKPMIPHVSTLPLPSKTSNSSNNNSNNSFPISVTSPPKTNSETNQPKFQFPAFGASSTFNADKTNNVANTADSAAAFQPKPFTTFNFASTPSPSNLALQATLTSSKTTQNETNEDDPTPKDAPTQISREDNDKEDVIHETRAKYLKMGADKKWKSYCTGNLRLYKSKTSDASRLVLRNDIGKVQLNIALYKGMKFTKNTKPKKSIGYVGFIAIADQTAGMESFNLVVKLDQLDKLVNSLEKLTS